MVRRMTVQNKGELPFTFFVHVTISNIEYKVGFQIKEIGWILSRALLQPV